MKRSHKKKYIKLPKSILAYNAAMKITESRRKERSEFLNNSENFEKLTKFVSSNIRFDKIINYLRDTHCSKIQYSYSDGMTLEGQFYSNPFLIFSWDSYANNAGSTQVLTNAINNVFELMLKLILDGLTTDLTKDDVRMMIYASPTIVSIIPEKFLDDEMKTLVVELDPNNISLLKETSAKLQKFSLTSHEIQAAREEYGYAYEKINNPAKSVFLTYTKKLLKEFSNFDLYPENTKDWIYNGYRSGFKNRFEHIIRANLYNDTKEFQLVKEALTEVEAAEAAENLLKELK